MASSSASSAVRRAAGFDVQLKLLIIGDVVGKTCLLLRYANDSFTPNPLPTIGIDFKIKNIQLDGLRVKLQIWDTAGPERFRTITTSYFRGSQCVIIVYDVRDRMSFMSVRNWVAQLQMHGSVGVPFIVVGNCCDDYYSRVISYDEGASLAAEYNCPFVECSAKTGLCVENVFLTAASKALQFGNIDFFQNLIKKGDFANLKARESTLSSLSQHSDDVDYSLLMDAARFNQYDIAVWLMDTIGIDVTMKNKDGATVLHLAGKFGALKLMQLFRQRGCDLFMLDKANKSVLMYCAEGTARAEVIDYCMSEGLDINAVDSMGQNALFHAIATNNLQTVEYLLLKGVNWKHIDNNGCTALLAAARSGSMALVDFFVKKGLNLDLSSQMTQTIFFEVLRNNWIEIAKWFIDQGIDVNAYNPVGDVALFQPDIANKDIIKLLISSGASVDSLSKNGDTLMILAAKGGKQELLTELLASRANVNQANSVNGRTTLMAAGCQLSIVQWLVSHGAKLDAVDNNGYTAFSHVLQRTSTYYGVTPSEGETIKWYLSQPGIFISENIRGATDCRVGKNQLALLKAIQTNNMDGVQSILKNEIYLNIDARDEMGRTPLMHAGKAGKLSIIELLIQQNADTDMTDQNGFNAFALAIECAHTDCAMNLLSASNKRRNVILSDTKLIPEGDQLLLNVIVPDLLQSLVNHNDALKSRVEPMYLTLKEEAAILTAKQNKRATSFMRYFWR